ncbi:MAG TPA: hypothetical protein VH475_00150 [Tepidisphaeraceae bacterium]|jgi:hypothetical protein
MGWGSARDQLIARLVGGHFLEVRPDGMVMMLRDERVPRVFLAELADKQMVEQVKPEWWAISDKGRRRLR